MPEQQVTHYVGDSCPGGHLDAIASGVNTEVVKKLKAEAAKLNDWEADEYTPVDAARFLLEETTGADFDFPHLKRTPERFVQLLREMTTQEEDFNFTTFDNAEHIDEMVVIQDIPFYSLCAHHVVPFSGIVHIAYIPDNYIAGLSKFARAVKFWSKGLWVQEELTVTIADYLEEKLTPLGVAVVVKANHLCIEMRGVQTPGTLTTTSAMRGYFGEHDRTAKQEFLSMINGENK